MPDRRLDSLSSTFYPKACELIARVTARGVAVLVLQTSRTEAEHVANLANGTSSTARSLHLPRRLRLSTLEGRAAVRARHRQERRDRPRALRAVPAARARQGEL